MIILATDITTSMGHEVDMTRDRAYMLNSQVNSFLSSCPLYLDNGNMRTLVLLMNDGEDTKGRELAWTGFGHDFIHGQQRSCSTHFRRNGGGADGAIHSVSDLPSSSNGGGANRAIHPISDHSAQQKRRRSGRSCSTRFGPFTEQKL